LYRRDGDLILLERPDPGLLVLSGISKKQKEADGLFGYPLKQFTSYSSIQSRFIWIEAQSNGANVRGAILLQRYSVLRISKAKFANKICERIFRITRIFA
jgi:hypothetical protein